MSYKYNLYVNVGITDVPALKSLSDKITVNFQKLSGTNREIQLVFETTMPIEITANKPLNRKEKNMIASRVQEFYQEEFGERYKITASWTID